MSERSSSVIAEMKLEMLSLFAVVAFIQFFYSHAAVGNIPDDVVAGLATKVLEFITAHKHGNDDAKKITYLYIHEEEQLKEPHYTNDVLRNLKTKDKVRKLRGSNYPYFPTPAANDFKPGQCTISNLMIGTIPTPPNYPKLKRLFDPLALVQGPKCPKLVIYGRSKYADKNLEIGLPKGDDGYFNLKKIASEKCSSTEFYYYVHEKPRAERVLSLLEKNHVNMVYNSDFP